MLTKCRVLAIGANVENNLETYTLLVDRNIMAELTWEQHRQRSTAQGHGERTYHVDEMDATEEDGHGRRTIGCLSVLDAGLVEWVELFIYPQTARMVAQIIEEGRFKGNRKAD